MVAQGFKTLFNTNLTTVKTASEGDTEGVGTVRQEGEQFYRWVKNAESVDLKAGVTVCFTLANAGTAFRQLVYFPAAGLYNYMGGITVGAIPTLGFGWILIEGYSADILVRGSSNSTLVIGQIMVPQSIHTSFSTDSHFLMCNGHNISDGAFTMASAATNASQAAFTISGPIGYGILGETTASSAISQFLRTLGVHVHCLQV